MSPLVALPLALAAGVLTILSPCVLPLAPIVVASGRSKDPRGPLALATGLALTFAGVGGGLAAFGVEVGSLSGLRFASAAILFALGLALLVPRLAAALESGLGFAGRGSDFLAARLPRAGLLGQAATGGVLALAWAPCAGPTLGAAFALAANGGSIAMAMLTMFVYALGAAGALLAVGYGLGRLTGRGRAAAAWTGLGGRIALGASLAAIGLLVFTGLDHQIEAALIDAMPDWLANAATAL